MSVTPDDVRHVAQLARLAIPDEHLAALVGELNGILQHMQVLSDVMLDAELGGSANALDALTKVDDASGMPLRDDIAHAASPAWAGALQAPAMRDGFFLVPRLSTHNTSAGKTATDQTANDDEDEA